MLRGIQKEIRSRADEDQAAVLRRFFKTGPGEYGEGDKFLGLKVPVIRSVVKSFPNVPPITAAKLLLSPWHEERLAGLLFLVRDFEKENEEKRREIYKLYLANTLQINNWDLVDLSAPQIIGSWLFDRSRRKLHQLARSRSLWERRIAIVGTHYFIRRHDFAETLRLAEMLLNDKHDLIQKACGWMLREVGKRDEATLDQFMCEHCHTMPRTMLRYAIEKMEKDKRLRYMRGEI